MFILCQEKPAEAGLLLFPVARHSCPDGAYAAIKNCSSFAISLVCFFYGDRLPHRLVKYYIACRTYFRPIRSNIGIQFISESLKLSLDLRLHRYPILLLVDRAGNCPPRPVNCSYSFIR